MPRAVQAQPEFAPAGVAEFHSPSLEHVIALLGQQRKHQILDLGMPSEANVEFLSQFRCTLYVEDLFRHLISRPQPRNEDGSPVIPDFSDVLSFGPGASFDAVFGWDLFAYLELDVLRALMKHVAACCKPGTLLFIIGSTLETISAEPAKLTITASGKLRHESGNVGMHMNPRYTPLALERTMPGFSLRHSFLLRDGLQDYLFAYE